MIAAAWICLFMPLGAAALITIGGNRFSRRAAAYIATASVAGAFVAACISFAMMLGRDDREVTSTAWEWLTAGNLRFGLSILVDPLSVFMMLVVSGVGGMIVGYSIGYMDGEDEERRYFAYMALFVFSMLLLVQSGNLLMLLAGWGLVGLCSYLLIGYHHERPSAVAAAKKAFVMNAVGDATMALALIVLIFNTGTLDWEGVFFGAPGLSDWAINLVALGLLGGAVAKSAQLPLHTWLPDAMEGPTPVSALIHAATMVTAGVFLIVRAHPLFELAPRIQDLAAGLGAATLLMAGLIGLVQTDIKQVIAYSTMSQIGYMFLGAGVGAYATAMFHLMTHAFFKALLFLAAGIVIHALLGEQDMRRMGGLRALMPGAWLAMWVGGLALAGIPPFAGFFSKDSILASALDRGWYGVALWLVAMVGVFLTGLYTFRMIFLVFGGGPSAYVQEHPPHMPAERVPRRAMTWTVAALTLLSAVGGFVQFAGVWTPISDLLDAVAEPLVHATGTQEAISSIFAVTFGLAGIWVAWYVYAARREPPPKPWPALGRKFWFDEAYDALFYKPAVGTTRALYALVEGPIIAGTITGVAGTTRIAANWARGLQTGLVRTYVLAVAASLAVLAVVFIAVR